MDNNTVTLAQQIIDAEENGLYSFAVEAVSLQTGEVITYPFVLGYDNKSSATEKTFIEFPMNEWKVTFLSTTWARQTIIQYMIGELDSKEAVAAIRQSEANKLPTDKIAQSRADFSFYVAWQYAETVAEKYRKYTGYSINKGTALRSVATRNINYSLIK